MRCTLASLAYRIACKNNPHNLTRANAMKDINFIAQFENAKDYIRKLNVATVEITNPFVLYIFEAFCAMKFDTSKWNTFETH